MKTVEELKQKIELSNLDDDAFEKYLFDKYPSLFYQDENGHMLPQSQRCWCDCPEGWRHIVDNLCGAIVNYTQQARYVPDPKKYILTFITQQFRRFSNSLNALHIPRVEKVDRKIRKYLFSKIPFIKVYPQPVKVDQYKEKFGGLRFYTDSNDEHVEGMIAFAEYLSLRTCQNTGKPGQLCKKGHWYVTLSEEEAKVRNYTPV